MPNVTHPFVSAKSNSSDASLASSNAWNATHAIAYTVQSKSADYSVAAGDDVIVCTGTMNLTLPAATGSGRPLQVVFGAGTVAVTIVRNGSDTLGPYSANVTVSTAGDSVTLTDVAANKWSWNYSSGHELREAWATTATAGGTTTLTNLSPAGQIWTGSSTQAINLPNATTMSKSWSFRFHNDSTGGYLTIYAADGTTVIGYVAPGHHMEMVLTDNSTSNGTWQVIGQQTYFAAATPAQQPSATVRTYITGSAVKAPVGGKFKIGSTISWRFEVTKTGAGTASSTYDICFGTAGSTSDTARVSFTKPAGTGVADKAWVEVTLTIKGPLSASCIAVGSFWLGHNLNSTGHATISNVTLNVSSSAFDITAANTVGLCVTSGAADALTIEQVTVDGRGL